MKINNPPNNIMRTNILFINTAQNIMAKLNGKLNLTKLVVDVIPNTWGVIVFMRLLVNFNLERKIIIYITANK